MKRRFFMPILAGAIMLTSFGVFIVTAGQPSQNRQNNSRYGIPITNNGSDPAITNSENDFSVKDEESDPAVEARNIKEEFRGINLTAQQLAQVTQVRRQFRNELREVMTSNLGQVLMLMVLPKNQAERRFGDLMEKPITKYGEGLSKILTPEQLKLWQRNAEQTAQGK